MKVIRGVCDDSMGTGEMQRKVDIGACQVNRWLGTIERSSRRSSTRETFANAIQEQDWTVCYLYNPVFGRYSGTSKRAECIAQDPRKLKNKRDSICQLQFYCSMFSIILIYGKIYDDNQDFFTGTQKRSYHIQLWWHTDCKHFYYCPMFIDDATIHSGDFRKSRRVY